ncbi:hypothetical protein [Hahella ganghwensis]|uniref:hypothetical protein n=1 Tax=Hahella ganghwensis TaxID=286420 RepID=UPI0003678DE8|nr:hypothetical protein [Hahella ganghwensis]
MRATHLDAERRYTIIRKAVIDEINKEFHSSKQYSLKATLIDISALEQSNRWNFSPKRKVDWEWIDGYNSFRFRYPKRFEMALWHKDTLASLSLGRPTYQGSKLRLDFIEGNPDKPNDVKVFEPTFLAMVGYAQALGANELRIMNPINDDVMNPINDDVRRYYERFGFTYVIKNDYLFVRL